jgi:small-conductance mechanosensitive channel
MNEIQNIFLTYPVYLTIIICLLVFGIFKLLKTKLSFFFHQESKILKNKAYLSAIELIIWIIFGVWAILFLWDKSQIFSIILIALSSVLLFWFSWVVLKDYLAGLFIRASRQFSLEDQIILKDYEGQIIKFKARYMVIAGPKGQETYIPFSHLLNTIFFLNKGSNISAYSKMQITLKSTKNTNDRIDGLHKSICNLPLISLKHKPKIVVLEENNKEIIIEISFLPIEKDQISSIKKQISQLCHGIFID